MFKKFTSHLLCSVVKVENFCALYCFSFLKDTSLLWQYNLLYLNIARLGFMDFFKYFLYFRMKLNPKS